MLGHPNRRWPWRMKALRLAVVGCALAVAGCGGSGEGTEEGPPPRTYELRGVIRQISETADGDTRLWIHHETVPDFVGLDGKVEPMKAMIMPFTVSDTLDVSDLAPATKIAFELTVDWSAAEPGLITAIEILPEGTVLAFESRR